MKLAVDDTQPVRTEEEKALTKLCSSLSFTPLTVWVCSSTFKALMLTQTHMMVMSINLLFHHKQPQHNIYFKVVGENHKPEQTT